MLTIRLQRTGRVNNPTFRVVLTDKRRSSKTGNFKEILGSYEPKAGKMTLKADRVKHWIKMGAQPSDTMHNFLIDQKLVEGKKINVLPKKTKQVKTEEAAK